MVHANRLRPFKYPKDLTIEKIESVAATDLMSFMLKKLLDIRAPGRIRRSGSFECVGSDMSLKTIQCWTCQLSRTSIW